MLPKVTRSAVTLTDTQWAILAPLIRPAPEPGAPRPNGRPLSDQSPILQGILWILDTGTKWKDLPERPGRYAPRATCHRWLRKWSADGSMDPHCRSLGRHGLARGETGPAGRFCRRDLRAGEKGGLGVGCTKKGKGSKIMMVCDANGLPLAAPVGSASPHESKLVEATLDARWTERAPSPLIGDRAYDRDALDATLLEEHGVEPVSPHRRGRMRPPTQAGRTLRRYSRRWKIERLFAWLGNRRRLLVRHESRLASFAGFVTLGCIPILLKRLFG